MDMQLNFNRIRYTGICIGCSIGFAGSGQVELESGRTLALKPENVAARNHCAGCGAQEEDQKFQLCNGCKLVRYCSRDCQKAHWKKEHKVGML